MRENTLFVFFITNRVYVDKNKVAKFQEISGSSADLLEQYKPDGSQSFDIYESRWQFADHMSFYLPACARSAFTVSIGNSSSETNLKSPVNSPMCPLTPSDLNASNSTLSYEEVEFLNEDVCI